MENTNLLDEAYKKILASEELQTKFVEAIKENKLDAFLKEQKHSYPQNKSIVY